MLSDLWVQTQAGQSPTMPRSTLGQFLVLSVSLQSPHLSVRVFQDGKDHLVTTYE